MQGLIFDIKRFTIHDGPGIRTTVFFKGCPLSCRWCHNPESISPETETVTKHILFDGRMMIRTETIGRYYTKNELLEEISKDKIFYDESGGGVTFSGGEPLLQHAFLKEMLIACRANGIHTALDTSGYAGEKIFQEIAPLADLLLFDIKELDETRHFHATAVSNKPVMQNLEWLSESKIKTILRAPIIPGFTLSDEYTEALKRFLLSLETDNIREIDLLPYHATAGHKYERCDYENRMGDMKTVEKNALIPMKTELEKTGWTVKIGG